MRYQLVIEFDISDQYKEGSDKLAEVMAAGLEYVFKQAATADFFDGQFLSRSTRLYKQPPVEWVTVAEPIKNLSNVGLPVPVKRQLQNIFTLEDSEG